MNEEAIKTLNSRIKNIEYAIEYQTEDYVGHLNALKQGILDLHFLNVDLKSLQESVKLLQNA